MRPVTGGCYSRLFRRESCGRILLGLVNYHTVHHLFSMVRQYHCLEITPIVEKLAEERGWRVHVERKYTFLSGCIGHVAHLRRMAQKGENCR